MLGYTPGEMIDREVLSFVPKEVAPVVRRADEKRSKGISDRYELPTSLHSDGTRRDDLGQRRAALRRASSSAGRWPS